jgi:hypothetical protein
MRVRRQAWATGAVLGVVGGCGLAVRGGFESSACETAAARVAPVEALARTVLLGPAYEQLRAKWRLPPQVAPTLVTEVGACGRAAAALRAAGEVDVARGVILFRGAGVYVAQDADAGVLTFILDQRFRVLDTVRVPS